MRRDRRNELHISLTSGRSGLCLFLCSEPWSKALCDGKTVVLPKGAFLKVIRSSDGLGRKEGHL